jgi:hypothetical protein
MTLGKFAQQGALAALIGLAGLAATASTASAYVACNRYGDCWHTENRDRFPVRLHVRFHDDDWQRQHDWDRDHRYHWRGDHDGRGYWRNGVWIGF